MGAWACIASCVGCGSGSADKGAAGVAGSGVAGSTTAAGAPGTGGVSTAGAGASGTGNGGGTGSAGNAGSEALSCPATPPSSGSQCSAQGECTYLDCSGDGQITTRCNGITISVEKLPCATTRCGGVGGRDCAAGQICVEFSSTGTPMQKCVANPCAGSALECDCASSECAGNSCSTNGLIVSCGGTCPDC